MSASNKFGRSASAPGFALLTSHCLVLLSLVLLSACTAPSTGRDQLSSSGVTVVGVTAKTGLNAAINRNSLARDFAQFLASRQQFPVISASLLRETIGSKPVDEMLNRYARGGQLAQRDIQLLMAAGLTTPYAVIARVESDVINVLPERRDAMAGSNGTLLIDRQRTIQSTQRITQVSAILFDLRTGTELWNRHYRVDPVSEVASTAYHGSSFSESLAAAFANTVVNGISVSRQPSVPPLTENIRSLLGEIAANLPVR